MSKTPVLGSAMIVSLGYEFQFAVANEKARKGGGAQQSAVRRLQRRLRITPLDRLIIDAVVDSRQGVVGALSKQELTMAVDEFVGLNGRRQQSYFHVGFRDALFDLPFDADLPAKNESRARWYWAGAIQGWARSESWDRIVEAYDSTGVVRVLGDGGDPASRMAGAPIAEALWKTGRTADLHVFVGVGLARQPMVFQLLLDAGTESLRSRNPGVARTVFALLMEAGGSLKTDDPITQDVPTVRRRMAHCLRLLGERQGAEDLLQGLFRDERDPGIHAMVHADLGLLRGGFTLLDEVRIPGDETARRDLVDRLRAGERHFRDSVADPDATYACHGHYCLGVLSLADDALGDDRFAKADMHLERAHASIRSNRAYPASLVAQSELYLGIAKLQLFDAAEIHHAAQLIVSGLKGAQVPRHFIAPTVENLALSDESIETVAGPLLVSGGDEIVDALADTAILGIYAPLAEKLHERARRPNRGKALAAGDLREALSGYLGVGDVDTACEILDELEQLAIEGSGVPEFLELLDDPDRYEPAWEQDDAAVASARCLEAAGAYAESLAKLRGIFHSYMHKGDIPNASGVLERIETYGLDRAEYVDLERRYHSSTRDEDPELQNPGGAGPVAVLVVGGNETQAKIAGRVKSKVATSDPQVTVDFLHTGWTSSWNQYVDETERRLASSDGVVVMRYIRTMLGRRVRAMCRARDVPWRFCWSGGQGGLVESVLAVAGAVRVRQSTD